MSETGPGTATPGWSTDLVSLCREAPAPFAEERLASYSRALERTLLTGRVSVQSYARVDLSRVRGVSHPAYVELSWEQLLTGGRSARNLEALRDNPGYYLSEEQKDIFVTALGDDLYISGGVHRTVIARFFCHYNQGVLGGCSWLSGVRLEQYEVDIEAQEIVERVRSLLAKRGYDHIAFQIVCDGLREEGRYRFTPRNRRSGQYRQFARDELLDLADTLGKPRRGRRCRELRAWNILIGLQRT